MTKDAEQLARIKAGLKCTDEEAAEILAYDKAVDHGEATPHDLTPAQNKVAQSYAHTGTRKPNEPKREIIQVLTDALTPLAEEITTTNPERQLDFTLGGVRYRVVLSAPRK